jgi:hypothetical protein
MNPSENGTRLLQTIESSGILPKASAAVYGSCSTPVGSGKTGDDGSI